MSDKRLDRPGVLAHRSAAFSVFTPMLKILNILKKDPVGFEGDSIIEDFENIEHRVNFTKTSA